MGTCLPVCACKFLVVSCAIFQVHVQLVLCSKGTLTGISHAKKTNLKVEQPRVGSLKSPA